MEKAAKNFHLPLSEGLYRRLRREADRCGTPATRLVRKALERYLVERERQSVHDAIVSYAVEMSGTGADHDEDFGA